MLIIIVSLVAGLAGLYFGGEGLVRGSSSLALRFGISPLVIGLTIVAFGTSAPELVVSLRAALSGSADLALGNVVGSNICNAGLVLGLAVLIRPVIVHGQVLVREAPVMLASTALVLVFLIDRQLGRLEGAVLLLGLCSYLGFTYLLTKKERSSALKKEFEAEFSKPLNKPWLDATFILGGFALLVLGAEFFVSGAVGLARQFGVSEAVIGLTLVSVGTSLPELATSVIAAWKDEGDIAIGNVIGSNIFNLLGILGVTSLARPLGMVDLSWIDLGVMSAVAVTLMTLMLLSKRLSRLEGGVLLAAYIGYIFHLGRGI